MSKIKYCQYSFINRLYSMPENDATVLNIMQICGNSRLLSYYKELNGDNYANSIKQREERIKTSTN